MVPGLSDMVIIPTLCDTVADQTGEIQMARFTNHRLHALCPYFAMFPPYFAREMILRHTSPGEIVLDPFSGRGTTLLESVLLGRQGLALDINPVAACVTKAKADTPSLPRVLRALDDLETEFNRQDLDLIRHEKAELPEFFGRAFFRSTLNELLFLRGQLDWRRNEVECFIAALALGSLHGEMDRSKSYFSNQMPRTISTKPNYSLRYWRTRGLWPKKRCVFTILRQRAKFRLQTFRPQRPGVVTQSDVRQASRAFPSYRNQVDAIVTSPPYLNVTNFEEDQWLRLWFLGGEPKVTYGKISKDDRYTDEEKYWSFLSQAWKGVGYLVTTGSRVVCRLGGKGVTPEQIAGNLYKTVIAAWPTASMVGTPVESRPGRRQTDNFRPGSTGPGPEVDFVFQIL